MLPKVYYFLFGLYFLLISINAAEGNEELSGAGNRIEKYLNANGVQEEYKPHQRWQLMEKEVGTHKKLQQEHKDIKELTGLWRENVNGILSDVDVHMKNGRLPQDATKEKLKAKAYPTSPKRSQIRH